MILMPLIIWSLAGIIIFAIGDYLVNTSSVCQIDENNYNKEEYTTPHDEHLKCMNMFYVTLLLFGRSEERRVGKECRL